MSTESDLQEAKEVLDSLKISWWVTSGTLLGIVRNGELIPWDTDIDIALRKELDHHRARDIVKKFKQAGFLAKARFGERPEAIAARRDQGIVINLGFYEEVEEGLVEWHDPRGKISLYIPAHFLEGASYVVLNEVSYSAPVNPKKYLRWHYGNNWQQPTRGELKDFTAERFYKKERALKDLEEFS